MDGETNGSQEATQGAESQAQEQQQEDAQLTKNGNNTGDVDPAVRVIAQSLYVLGDEGLN